MTCPKHHFDWKNKTDLQIHLYVSDDPRLHYEPVCYEMLVAREYYAQKSPYKWW